MAAAGLRQNVMTLKWDPAAPMTIPDQAFLDGALPAAQAAGIKVVFAALRLPSRRPSPATAARRRVRRLDDAGRRTYPGVTTFIVGNEPNQPRFWRPQFDGSGAQASAAAFGPLLAAATTRSKRSTRRSRWSASASPRAGTTGRTRRATSRRRPSAF